VDDRPVLVVAIAISDQGIEEEGADEAVHRTQRRRSSHRRVPGEELSEDGLNGMLRNATQLGHRVGPIHLLQELVTVYQRTLGGEEGPRTDARHPVAHRELDARNWDSEQRPDLGRDLLRPVLAGFGPAVLEQPPSTVCAGKPEFSLGAHGLDEVACLGRHVDHRVAIAHGWIVAHGDRASAHLPGAGIRRDRTPGLPGA